MYLTYDEYINLGGKALDETTFEQIEFEARAVIDWWTFNRLQNESEYPEPVKRCMLKLITLIYNRQIAMEPATVNSDTEGATAPGIMRQSNDDVATTYNVLGAKDAMNSIQKELHNVVRMHLQGVKNSLGQRVLYRGIYPNE